MLIWALKALKSVPFMLVHAGKYRTEDKLKIHTILKLNTTPRKSKQHKTAKQNYPDSVTSYGLGQKMRWAYSTTIPSPHRTAVQCTRMDWYYLGLHNNL